MSTFLPHKTYAIAVEVFFLNFFVLRRLQVTLWFILFHKYQEKNCKIACLKLLQNLIADIVEPVYTKAICTFYRKTFHMHHTPHTQKLFEFCYTNDWCVKGVGKI